ncbi:Diacylglycerol kinase kappa [Bienertia sinuspersici]
MGQSLSTETPSSIEERELESEVASTGSLPFLHRSFSKFQDSDSQSISIPSLQGRWVAMGFLSCFGGVAIVRRPEWVRWCWFMVRGGRWC